MRLLLVLTFLFAATTLGNHSYSAQPPSDQQLRTIVRKKAPFWLFDKDIKIRVNKDGTTDAGYWKVEKGLLRLTFASGNPDKSYVVDIGHDRVPTINGAALKAGRYVLR